MSNKRFSGRAILIAIVITFLVTGGVGLLAARCLLGPGGLAVLEGMSLIDRRFIAEYDEAEAADGALNGMVDALGDRWSHYLNPEESAALRQARTNAYVGIGITYQRSDDPLGMAIVSVTEGGPAQKAGLCVGEWIVAVDGRPLTEENFDELVASIAGAEGETRTLSVRSAQGVEREVTLTLDRVEEPPAEGVLLDGHIGYVRLENFYQNTAASAEAAVEELLAQGAKGLIFDVRSNPGGYVSELTKLLDYLLPEGPIFTEHSKNGPTKVTNSDANCVDLPMVVLVNEDSYSAAELFAAQLRESVNAKLVGGQTCGKGYYQQGFPLPNGGELHISTGMYTTGGGVSLIGTGLTPDYEVEGADAQMDKAVEALKAAIEER